MADGQGHVGQSGEGVARAMPPMHAAAGQAVGVEAVLAGWRVMAARAVEKGEGRNRGALKRKNPHLGGCGF